MQRYGKATNISPAKVLLLQSILRIFVIKEQKINLLKYYV